MGSQSLAGFGGDRFRRHEGHDHGADPDNQGPTDGSRNHLAACMFWYMLAIVLVLGFVRRLVRTHFAKQRVKDRGIGSRSQREHVSPLGEESEPQNTHLLGYVCRFISFSGIYALPLWKIGAVALYVLFVIYLLTWDAITHDVKYLERLGFRAAWVTVTQTALPFLLIVRLNPVGLILGVSYERMNWFHKWVSRVWFASATTHGTFFLVEFIRAELLWDELKTVGMVKWGIFAWLMLLWTIGSSLLPFRRWNYEFFIVQHIASAVLLFVFLFLHVPVHHQFSVWCALGVFLYDVATRLILGVLKNMSRRSMFNKSASYPSIGYPATLNAIDDEQTVVTIHDVAFRWSPAQHVLIYASGFWRQTAHPFTIANTCDLSQKTQDLQLVLKAKSGFTKDLNTWARRREIMDTDAFLPLIIAGPYGMLPNWRGYDSLLLVSASTGGSFATPILEELLTSQSPGCLRSITALYVVRRKSHASVYLDRLRKAWSEVEGLGLDVRVDVAITGQGVNDSKMSDPDGAKEKLMDEDMEEAEQATSSASQSSGDSASRSSAEMATWKKERHVNFEGFDEERLIEETFGRPNVYSFVKNELGGKPGNTAIGVCAGRAIERDVQRAVADLRASGPSDQNIMIHMERMGD